MLNLGLRLCHLIKNMDKKPELHWNFIRLEDSTLHETLNAYLDIILCSVPLFKILKQMNHYQRRNSVFVSTEKLVNCRYGILYCGRRYVFISWLLFLLFLLGLFLLPASAVDYTHWFNDGQDLSLVRYYNNFELAWTTFTESYWTTHGVGMSIGVSISVSVSVHISVGVGVHSFVLKFLRPHYFQTLWWIWFIFGMMIDTGPKFYSVLSPPPCMTFRSRSRT